MSDPYGRFFKPKPSDLPWQVKRKWLLVLMRLTKVVFFPLYILFFVFVWWYMKLHGYLFYGSRKHFFSISTRRNYQTGHNYEVWNGEWSYWNWGELKEKEEEEENPFKGAYLND